MLTVLKDKVLSGAQITKEDAFWLVDADIESLCDAANQIRKHFCGNGFDLCSVTNGKCGRCSEDCKFCAQSAFHQTAIEVFSLTKDINKLINEACFNHSAGIKRFSIVTSGRNLNDNETDTICSNYEAIKKECGISLCSSNGLLTFEQLKKLKVAGVTRYHCNLETSPRFFPKICTTHTYSDKLETIENARKAELEVCSGGIIGMGETMEDRIDMALELRRLNIKSVPVNILNAISGTAFASLKKISFEDIRRTVAIFRFILPNTAIRLAAGRGLFQDKGKSFFLSGANAAISGNMLTTSGIHIDDDTRILKELGFDF